MALHTHNDYLKIALGNISCYVRRSVSHDMFPPCERASILSACCKYVNANIICDRDSRKKDLCPFFFRRLVDATRTVCNLRWLKICFMLNEVKERDILCRSFKNLVQSLLYLIICHIYDSFSVTDPSGSWSRVTL